MENEEIRSMQESSAAGFVAVNMHGYAGQANPSTDHGYVYALANSIRRRFSTLPEKPMEKKKCTIFRVPHHVHQKSRDLYEPQVVSIGPYHHGRKHLKCMEEQKLRYLRDFLSRSTRKDVAGAQLDACLLLLKDYEYTARKRYYGAINLGSKEFLEMLLLDGCFMLEFLLKNFIDDGGGRDGVSQASWNWHLMINDMLMLENQIPFFVLRELFDLVLEDAGKRIRPRDDCNITIEYGEGVERSALVDLFVTYVMWDGRKKKVTLLLNDFFHLLHLYHHCFIPPLYTASTMSEQRRWLLSVVKALNPVKLMSLTLSYVPLRLYFMATSFFRASSTGAIPTRIPCATKLMDAGVRFKTRASDNFLDVRFDSIDGVLRIPHVRIHKTTKSRFMNLVAFEQCGLVEPRNMTSYAQFMDYMIDSSKDVAALQQCGIIESVLGSDEETAAFFNQLSDCSAMDPNRGYLGPVFRDIINYCKLEWHEWRARFRRDYFSNPWTILSLAAAIVLLILTFLQTFFAIYAYYHPPS